MNVVMTLVATGWVINATPLSLRIFARPVQQVTQTHPIVGVPVRKSAMRVILIVAPDKPILHNAKQAATDLFTVQKHGTIIIVIA